MLRIIQSQNATAARHYFDEALAKGDGYYFADRGEREIVGHWFGRDAERLGLAGPVDRDAFHALVEGKDPRSGEPLLQRMRDDRRPGYDFNFHAPKSVSLFYELSRDERIRLAFEQSVRDTMTEIEKDMATRDQSGGKSRKVKTGSMVAAEFTHFTSRPAKEDSRPDPHLHMHVFVMNATHDERRGRWYAPEFHDLHIDRPYHQAAFQKRLASRLQGLGYAVVKTDDAFEIEGVQRATIDKFSRRAREVEDEARRKGITDAKEKDKLGAKTRGGKEKDLTRDELRSYWIGRLDPDEGRDLEAVAARARKGKAAAPEGPTAAQAIDYARDHLFERRSAVSEKALLAEGLRHAVANPAVTPDGLAEEVRRRADFLHGTVKGERWLSTREVFDEEQRMIAFARDGLSSRTPFQRGRLDDAPIEADGKAAELSGEQKKAVRDLVQGSDRVQLLVGKAGTGKTTTLREIQKHVREGGYEFLTFAPSNNARDVLRRDGFGQAETVQKLLASSSLQDAVHRRSLIAVDEAGLLSSRDMARVCALAERKGARLLLIGDSLQHGSVERGDALRLLQQRAGLKAATLTRITRQREGSYREAVAAVSRGQVETGFRLLEANGAIKEVAGEERHLHLAAEYLDARAEGRTSLVISPSHAEKDRVTRIIRHELKARGEIGAEDRPYEQLKSRNWTVAERGQDGNYRPGDVVVFHQNAQGGFVRSSRWTVAGRDDRGRVLVEDGKGRGAPLPLGQAARYDVFERHEIGIAAGDTIRLTRNGTVDGHRVNVSNNDLFTIAGFTADGDLVTTKGWVLNKHYAHLEHGFSRTSHSSQGSTVDRVIVAQGTESFGASSREQFYVSISRGRERCTVYTDDKEGLLRAVDRSRQRLSATELMERSREDARESRARWAARHARAAANEAAGAAKQAAIEDRERVRHKTRSWVERIEPPRRPTLGR